MADRLSEQEIDRAMRLIVSPWVLETHLDTSWGTTTVVRYLREHATYSVSTSVDGFPYPEYVFRIEREARGFRVAVEHHEPQEGKWDHDRYIAGTTVLREGFIPWNNLANRVTIAACEARREQPREGDQLVLLA